MARIIEPFNAPKPPKIYEGHFPELVIHALNALNANGLDRARILESINTFRQAFVDDTHWMIIYQLSPDDVRAGTFTPGRITLGRNGYLSAEPLSYAARELLTKALYLNGKGLGCYVIRPYLDTLVSIPYSLEELRAIPELTVSVFAEHDADKIYWLNRQIPMYDIQITGENERWFGFTPEMMKGVADFTAWRNDGWRYNAAILLEQALFDISIDRYPNGDEFGVLIHMYDFRPRLTSVYDIYGNKDEPYMQEFTCMFGRDDKFKISFSREFGGDITIQKEYPYFQLTADLEEEKKDA